MIFIPTYNPNIKLINNLDKLTKVYPSNKIAVINDGSSKKNSIKILTHIKKRFKHIQLINLDKNFGKGFVIKKCLRYCKNKNINFALFIDDDGQHDVDDIQKILKNYKNQKKLIIGKRDTSFKKLPIASYIGNKVASIIFYLITKKYLNDTQCGLRLIPKNFFNFGINLESNKYDFEFEFLIKYVLKNKLITTPIKTIYFKNNVNSKFKKVKDSFLVLNVVFSKIYPNFLTFFSDIFFFILFNLMNFSFFLSCLFSKCISALFFLFQIKKKINFLDNKFIFILLNLLITFGLTNELVNKNLFQAILFYIILNFYFSIINFRILNKN